MITFCSKVASLLIVSLAFSTPITAQELKISDLPQPMDGLQRSPDLTGIAIPRKPPISSAIHLEKIRTVSADFGQQTTGSDVSRDILFRKVEKSQSTVSASDLKRSESQVANRYRGSGPDLFRRLVGGVVYIFTSDSFGSGAIIDPGGLVITNWHVVAGHQEAGVLLRPKGIGVKKIRLFSGQVIRTNKIQDLALLKFDATPIAPSDLTVLTLGHMSEVEVGMKVHAIGHPEGQNWSYTTGAVSQIRKRYSWRYDDTLQHEANVIQSQTPINPGNSGGPLFSDRGNIVGINSFGDQDSVGINFAVSVDNIRSLVKGEDPLPGNNSILPEPLSRYATSQMDRNDNGIPDAFGFDVDQNGKNELIAIDDNEDDKADMWVLDLNENGERDGLIVAANSHYDDVPGQLWLFDANEDGECELMGLDYNSDGQIDEYSSCD